MKLLVLLALIATPDPAATGSLEIRTQPRVEVVWEGTVLGATGDDGTLSIAGIPPGDYALTLRKAGFAEATVEVVAGAGEKTVLVLRLEPLTAAEPLVLSVKLQPEGPGIEATSDGPLPLGASPSMRGRAPSPDGLGQNLDPKDRDSGALAPEMTDTPEEPGPVAVAAPPPTTASHDPVAPSAAPSSPAAETGDGRFAVWPWALAAFGLLAVVLALRRRRGAPPDDVALSRPAPDPDWVKVGAGDPASGEASRDDQPPVPAEGPPRASDPAFLDELKRRESGIDPAPDDDVIDVDFVELPAGREP